jgi:hypothetical protein
MVGIHHLSKTFASDPVENPTLVFKVDQGNGVIGSTNASGNVTGATLYYAVNDNITLDAYVDCSSGNASWTVHIDNDGTGTYAGNGSGQFLANTTLNATGLWTVESHAQNGNMTLGYISGTIMAMDSAAAKAQDVSGTLQAGTVYRGLPSSGTLSVPIQAYLTDGSMSNITDEAQRPATFAWNVTCPAGSSATLDDPTQLGTSLSGIDVVGNYDLQAMAGPGSATQNVTVAVLEVLSLIANSTTIAAGAMNSTPHQTTLEATINPPVGNITLNFSLTGGTGYTGNTTKFDQQVNWYGPAKLQAGNQSYVAGETQNPIGVQTDAQGKATVTLTSSNKINENCTVKAEFGASSKTTNVTFGMPTVTVEFGGPIALGINQSINVNVTFNGQPLQGHDVFTYVRNVKADDTWLIYDWLVDAAWLADAEGTKALMDPYGEVIQGARQTTPQNGNITATLQVKSLDFDEMSMGAADASVHDGSQ